jgi:phospholipase/carboxylesterase
LDDAGLDDLVALLPPLLQSLEALAFVGRHLDPPRLAAVMEQVGAPDEALRGLRPRLNAWPERLAGVRGRLDAALDEVLGAFDALRATPVQGEGARGAFRALRGLPRAMEALYPLALGLPPINRFFLEPDARTDADLQLKLVQAQPRDDVGVMHGGGEPGDRGGFSLFVPEYYAPDRDWPVIVALHGGSGNGRAFLWSWLREARTRGAILISPTAIGDTWALSGPDIDTPNLEGILDEVRERWRIDETRLLLTGMSDGGTFTYVSGLEPASPFTHLAPVSAAFHPFLAEMADPERLGGLPIFLTHGARDWMFPIAMAREAHAALEAAGAAVQYREIADLSHTYPREINTEILDWMGVG